MVHITSSNTSFFVIYFITCQLIIVAKYIIVVKFVQPSYAYGVHIIPLVIYSLGSTEIDRKRQSTHTHKF